MSCSGVRLGIAHHFGWAAAVTASSDHKVVDRQRRAPYEARADSIMYRQVLAELARARGWAVHLYDAKDLFGPRAAIGPPWAKDHRMALAATIVADEDTLTP